MSPKSRPPHYYRMNALRCHTNAEIQAKTKPEIVRATRTRSTSKLKSIPSSSKSLELQSMLGATEVFLPPRHARRGGSSCTVDDFGDTKATRGTRLRRRGDARRTPRVWSVGAARSFVRSLSSSSRFRRSALWWAPKRGIGFPKNGRDAE